jgi:hypothetical protein
MITALLRPFLSMEAALPEHIPAGVGVYRNKWIPVFAGMLSGMRSHAAAVTLGDAILVHPDVDITPRLLRHELEHVKQWRAQPLLFPVRYALGHLRYGYDDNPFEVEARAAEHRAPPTT